MKIRFFWILLAVAARILSSAHHLLYYSHWVVDFEELSHETCRSPQSPSQASLWLLRCVWCWSCQRNHFAILFAFDLRFATQRCFEWICIGQMAKSHLRKWDIVIRPQRLKEATTIIERESTNWKERNDKHQTNENKHKSCSSCHLRALLYGDILFASIFLLDVLLRIVFMKLFFWKHCMNYVDFVATVLSAIEIVFSLVPFNSIYLRLARFGKLIRAVRMMSMTSRWTELEAPCSESKHIHEHNNNNYYKGTLRSRHLPKYAKLIIHTKLKCFTGALLISFTFRFISGFALKFYVFSGFFVIFLPRRRLLEGRSTEAFCHPYNCSQSVWPPAWTCSFGPFAFSPSCNASQGSLALQKERFFRK